MPARNITFVATSDDSDDAGLVPASEPASAGACARQSTPSVDDVTFFYHLQDSNSRPIAFLNLNLKGAYLAIAPGREFKAEINL